jgi:hypothetical protein
VFPARGSVISIGSVALSTRHCRQAVELRSLSLFGGAITASAVATGVGRKGSVSTSVRGLRVDGRRVPHAAHRVRVGRWGFLALGRGRAALMVRLVKRHAGLPAGADVVVAFAAPPRASFADGGACPRTGR